MNCMTAYRFAADMPEKALSGFECDRAVIRGKIVYLLVANDGRLKVGITSHPRRRIHGLVLQSGIEIAEILATTAIRNASAIEASFKARHRRYRIEGEWHRMPTDDARRFIEGNGWHLDDAKSAELEAAQTMERLDQFSNFVRRKFELEDSQA